MKTVIFATRRRNYVVPADQIMYCKAEGYVTHVHLVDQTSIRYPHHIGIVEGMIEDERFFRVNRDKVVNIHFVKEIGKEKQYTLVLNNGSSMRSLLGAEKG